MLVLAANKMNNQEEACKMLEALSKASSDDRLSLRAKGLLLQLIFHAGDQTIAGEIAKGCSDGRDAVYSALKELRALGYIKLVAVRSMDGKFVKWEHRVILEEEGDAERRPLTAEPQVASRETDVYPLEGGQMQNSALPERPQVDEPLTASPEVANLSDRRDRAINRSLHCPKSYFSNNSNNINLHNLEELRVDNRKQKISQERGEGGKAFRTRETGKSVSSAFKQEAVAVRGSLSNGATGNSKIAKAVLEACRILETADEEERALIALTEQEFGRKLSLLECSTLCKWSRLMSPEMVLEALERAVLRGVLNLKYAIGILRNWSKFGLKTPADVAAHEKKYREKRAAQASFERRQKQFCGLKKRTAREDEKYADLYCN